MALNCRQLDRDERCRNSTSGKSTIRTAALHRRHYGRSGIGPERVARMELMATFNHSIVRKRLIILPAGEVPIREGRMLPSEPAGILAGAEG